MSCDYCNGEKIEMDNNGPIVDCPVCESSRSPGCSTTLTVRERWLMREAFVQGVRLGRMESHVGFTGWIMANEPQLAEKVENELSNLTPL